MSPPVIVPLRPGWSGWRDPARALLAAEVEPDRVQWTGPDSLFSPTPLTPPEAPVTISRHFAAIARRVAHHRDEARAPLLYRILWRLRSAGPSLLRAGLDPDIAQLGELDAAVRRAAHKTKAFVRFRKVEDPQRGEHYIAWHRPEHPILPLVADFFAQRFSDMRWTIMTPEQSLDFDGTRWRLGPGRPRSAAPGSDELEALWRTYYRAIFNPARLMTKAMQAEMPRRHWSTLPEARDIPELIAQAGARVGAMLDEATSRPSVGSLIRPDASLEQLATASAHCRACPLHGPATQTVFGSGSPRARLMIVGEQPGDAEDVAGSPFVGPAGHVLRAALRAADIDEREVYFTNAVKHFSYVPQGKRRLHSRPRASHVKACRPWLLAEIERLNPSVIVLLGNTAARALLGATVKVTEHRGRVVTTTFAPATLVSVHPSAVLRAVEPARGRELEAMLTGDLRLAKRALDELKTASPASTRSPA